MAYASSQYRSTSAQWAYFHSLTGDNLPSGCSKSKASSLIKQALAGKYAKKRAVVSVHGQSIWCPSHRDHGVVKYVVDCDYRLVHGPFATFEEAEQVAKARYPGADIKADRNIIRQLMID